ncbi:MAG: hypothetical protein HY367_03750 [Candidatus Aenigmarchaeota archaeon]|nr:hypothetical protein [Candidatus Aenigmarchaeota archaeon]
MVMLLANLAFLALGVPGGMGLARLVAESLSIHSGNPQDANIGENISSALGVLDLLNWVFPIVLIITGIFIMRASG